MQHIRISLITESCFQDGFLNYRSSTTPQYDYFSFVADTRKPAWRRHLTASHSRFVTKACDKLPFRLFAHLAGGSSFPLSEKAAYFAPCELRHTLHWLWWSKAVLLLLNYRLVLQAYASSLMRPFVEILYSVIFCTTLDAVRTKL